MGKNAHGPRGNNPSKKPTNGGPAKSNNEPEGSNYIVFANEGDKKKNRNRNDASSSTSTNTPPSKGKGKEKAPADEDVPKKPDTRTLIAGGSSWTGKLPVNMLSEHCQKQKWEKPEYTMINTDKGFLSGVILRSKNPKTQEITQLPRMEIPKSSQDLAAQPTAVEARHFAAAFALFRLCNQKNIHMMMPPKFKDLWKNEFQSIMNDDVANGREWLYEADPFKAKKDHDEKILQQEKKREARMKEEAERASQPGRVQLSLNNEGSNLMKGWKTAAKVEMSKHIRREIEYLVKEHGLWNPNNITIYSQDREKLIKDVSELGFRKSHVEEAAAICKDREEVLEWLLIHIPEDDLPAWALPEGYTAGVSMASGNLKREAALKRLAAGGYDSQLCEDAYDAFDGNERKAAELLQNRLLQEFHKTQNGDGLSTAEVEEQSLAVWKDEMAVLSSIFEPEKLQLLNESAARIQLIPEYGGENLSLLVSPPSGYYPAVPPILSIQGTLPAYIRLSITKQCLQYALSDLLGEQMVFSLVDWLEREVPRIVENPGKLAEVISVGSPNNQPETENSQISTGNKRRMPQPVQWKSSKDVSVRILDGWRAKQNTPSQQKMLKARMSLPAWKLRDEIISATQKHQVLIISGETGSGKSTQAVQFILDDMIQRELGGAANIICTQPRRISALGLADRVSDERCSSVGEEVGYSIRGESKHTAKVTKITFVTTGVLLRRMQTAGGSMEDVKASIADITHIVVDEVHERSLDTDFLLALLREVIQIRKDLKVILMSATLDATAFEQYFKNSGPVGRVEIQGRTFPVTDYFLDDVLRLTGFKGSQRFEEETDESQTVGQALRSVGMGINYDLLASTVKSIHDELASENGGILIFLPGTAEINRTVDILRSHPQFHVLPLHASLLPSEQRRVFPPPPFGKRKVIAATNVAETSITIEDIVAVIDTGRVKETHYNAQTKMVKLEEVWASLAACQQRRGRAGRVRPGKCYKMFTRTAAQKMAERPDPEIRRVPLEQLCLSVKAMGMLDVSDFLSKTLTPPDSLAVEGAIDLLRHVGAVDGDVLTSLGRHMSMIPADLRCSKLMVHGALFGCLEACVTIASILTIKSPFVSPQEKREESKACRNAFSLNRGDIIADLRAYDAWTELKATRPFREVRQWCDQNFLSHQTLNDISSTRTQYISSLKEIGFLPISYQSQPAPSTNNHDLSYPLLHALLLSALHPQTVRISFPPQKYTPTMTGALAVDPESREIKYFESDNSRVFIHPSSTLFSSQSFPDSAGFLSYFQKIETSKVFMRELSPCGPYGMLMFGGPIELDTMGRGLVVDGWVRLRGWARIGVLVGRLRGILDGVLAKWIEEPGVGKRSEMEEKVVGLVTRLVELNGMDR